MIQDSTVVGLDVHKYTITAAILPPHATRPEETLTIDNHARAIERLVKRLTKSRQAVFVYEAGPCGYAVQRQLHHLGSDRAPCAGPTAPALLAPDPAQ